MATIEINDGFGSYICEYGYLHDYGKLQSKTDESVNEIVGPFCSVDELMKSLDNAIATNVPIGF